MDGRWGFEDADEDEFDVVSNAQGEDDEPGELVTGQDAAEIVAVSVTHSGEVVSVDLTAEWRSLTDPDALPGKVTDAMNAATAHALAEQAQQADINSDEPVGTNNAQVTSDTSEEDTPITRDYVMQLLGAVSVDVDRFLQQASAVTDQAVTSESSGAHVRVSGIRRQVSDVSVDARWAGTARTSEVEAELGDALAKFSARFSFGELAQGPRSPAITELMGMVSDPDRTIRRIKRRSSS